MSLRRLLSIVFLNLRRDARGALLSSLGIAAGIAALTFFVALGNGVADLVRTRIFPVDSRQVEVVPPRVSMGFFGGGKLDDEKVAQLAGLPEVVAAHRKMQLRVPAISRYDGVFFGQRLRMGLEILGEGVDPALLEGDLGSRPFTDPGPEGPIPVVISSRLLEIYNKSFARSRGLPAVSPVMLGGFRFPVSFGRSHVTAAAASGSKVLGQDAELVAVSDRAMLQGITMPLEAARRLNEAFGEDARSYSSVVLVAATPDLVPSLIEKVRQLGFDIDEGEKSLAERVGAAVAITTGALALLSLLICTLATVNIALTLGAAIRNRSREIGILRAVGATRRDVALLILGEAGAMGLFGGLVGAMAAWATGRTVDWAASRWLPDFPFRPDTFFHFTPGLLAGAVVLGFLAAWIGAWLPTHRASNLDPSRAMAS